jgi:hypothetical protein
MREPSRTTRPTGRSSTCEPRCAGHYRRWPRASGPSAASRRRIVGIVDRDAVLRAIAEEEGSSACRRSRRHGRSRPGRLARPLVAGKDRPGRRHRRGHVARVPRLERPSTRGPTTSSGTDCRRASIDPDLPHRPATRGRRRAPLQRFRRFRVFADNLVTWFNELLVWLTWIGTTVTGTLSPGASGGLRRAPGRSARSPTFAISGLWAESMETLALMLAAVGLSILIGFRSASPAGPLRAFQPGRSPRSSTRPRSSPRSHTSCRSSSSSRSGTQPRSSRR